MPLNPIVAISNGLTITASMVCMSYLYQQQWRQTRPRGLIASVLIIALTVLMFGLQLRDPELVPALRRDVAGLQAGQWWRVVTPLVVQPGGWPQFVFNLLFLVVFLPIAERLYGGSVWLVYVVSGVAGQLANYSWLPDGGGSSTAAFGLMGALLVYVLRHWGSTPRRFPVLAVLGLCGAVVMCINRDGHGAGLLTGACLVAAIPSSAVQERPGRVRPAHPPSGRI